MQTPKEFQRYTEEVLDMGAVKYGKDTWKRGVHFSHVDNHLSILRHTLKSMGLSPTQISKAVLQTLKDYEASEDPCSRLDDESGLDHLKHAMTRCGMQLYMMEHKLGEWQ